MRKKRLLWQIYPSYLLVTVLSLLAATWYASRSLRDFYLEETASDLEARARLIEPRLAAHLRPMQGKYVDTLCKNLGKKSSTRITVILASGKVIGDSETDPDRMDNHADRPEVMEALAGRPGDSTRYSYTLREPMMYVAIPVRRDDEIHGVLRTALPLTSIGEALKRTYARIALGGLIIALLVAVLSLLISRRISRPLEEMERGAKRFARGDLGSRLPVPKSEEIGALAEAMNQMAAQLDERIRTVTRQRNEREAILSSMVEGVLAIDTDEHVMGINRAAARLFGVDPAEATGRSIQEVVRSVALQRFVARTLSNRPSEEGEGEPLEGEILLPVDGERILQVRGTLLRDARGSDMGALIVLNDRTRIRQLENMRRDFVANVSHELRTPITSIKGFVETLLDGALHNPADAERFLGIIARQADRLNTIIEDLLSLSRIEEETEKARIVLEEGPIGEVLEAAVQACEVKAEAKNIPIELHCGEDRIARMSPPLLEQALVNLIDNAIKYSPPESPIRIETEWTDTELIIRVRDQGCGIEAKHLPRLFERFYRIDNARSRKLGGTGLGLAIVKHIALAHRGRVTVESSPGTGSTFAIHLPRA
jgi:two-component system phosphate regulon sensor histidine kinase PhoR